MGSDAIDGSKDTKGVDKVQNSIRIMKEKISLLSKRGKKLIKKERKLKANLGGFKGDEQIYMFIFTWIFVELSYKLRGRIRDHLIMSIVDIFESLWYMQKSICSKLVSLLDWSKFHVFKFVFNFWDTIWFMGILHRVVNCSSVVTYLYLFLAWSFESWITYPVVRWLCSE